MNLDATAAERSKRILQSYPEAPDHLRRIIKLFLVLFLRQMFIAQATPIITNLPGTFGNSLDCDLLRARQCLLIERVGYQFTRRMAEFPTLKNLFNIEIE